MRKIFKLTLGLMLSLLASQVVFAGWQSSPKGDFINTHVYVPSTKSPVGEGRSLMVVLHGCSQSIDALKSANMDKVAEDNGMIIAIPDAVQKQGFSCWGYWTSPPLRTVDDYSRVLSLVDAVLADSSLGVDPDQVYVAGLSSGGTFALDLALMAPDVFAGAGTIGAPTPGANSFGSEAGCAIGSFCEGDLKTYCLENPGVCGDYSDYLETQIYVSASGKNDTFVSNKYGPQNAEGMADIYQVEEGSSNPLTIGGVTYGTETLWSDNRVVYLELDIAGNLGCKGHAWPGGEGAVAVAGMMGNYVDNSNINYAEYLAKFFAENNKRVEKDEKQAPKIKSSSINSNQNRGEITVGAYVSDDDTFKSVVLTLKDSDAAVVETIDATLEYFESQVDGENTAHFRETFGAVIPGSYTVEIVVTDSDGLTASETKSTTVEENGAPDVGISKIDVDSDSGTIKVFGEAMDDGYGLDGTIVLYLKDSEGNVIDTKNGEEPTWDGEGAPDCMCTYYENTFTGVGPGEYVIEVVATDTGGLSDTATRTAVVEAAVSEVDIVVQGVDIDTMFIEGERASHSFVVSNIGEYDAHGVVVDITVTNAVVEESQMADCSKISSSRLSCVISEIKSGDSSNIAVTVMIDQVDEDGLYLLSTANAVAEEIDVNAGNNSDSTSNPIHNQEILQEGEGEIEEGEGEIEEGEIEEGEIEEGEIEEGEIEEGEIEEGEIEESEIE
ncbi:MAG: hypothetical protein D6B27_01490, partial [Gammaproteobacteria bacterium]